MKCRTLLALLSLACVPVVSAQVYTITNLGNFSPTAINSWGQVVGNRNGEAFIWAQFTGLKGLGKLSGGTASYAASINDLGVVTGTADGAGTVISQDPTIYPNEECSDVTQPFVWAPVKGMKGLGTVGPRWIFPILWCDIAFSGTGVNDGGEVVGYTGVSEGSYQWGFFWTKADGMTLIGITFPPSWVNGINNSGQIAGQTGIYIGQATLWKGTAGTTLQDLGGGGGSGSYSSSANGVNDRGQAVGWSTTGPLSVDCQSNLALCPMHAVLWTPSGEISDLGTLEGDTFSVATNISSFGQVIGSSGNALGSLPWGAPGGAGWGGELGPLAVIGRPFVWSPCSGMQDLNTLIPGGSGWVLNLVSGINSWGQIVGSGTVNGQTRGFLLTPRGFQCI